MDPYFQTMILDEHLSSHDFSSHDFSKQRYSELKFGPKKAPLVLVLQLLLKAVAVKGQ